MTVTLGAHNIKRKERTQQIIPVREIIRPSGYTSETFLNDIMLLQVGPSLHWFLCTLFLGALHSLGPHSSPSFPV